MNMFPVILVKLASAGTYNTSGDPAKWTGHSMRRSFCNHNYRVSDHECVQCAPGTYNSSGDDASGPDTVCDVIQCAENEYVSSHIVKHVAGTYNTSGDLADFYSDTVCDEYPL